MCWLSKITKISLSFMIFKNWDNSLWNTCNICIDSGLVQTYCPISRGYYKNYKLLESSKGKYAQWPKKLRLSSWKLPRVTNWRIHSTKALSRLCEFWIQHILKFKLCFAGHGLECFKCVSSKSWDDCDSNKQVMTSPSSYDVCGKISYEEKSKGVPSKFFVEACWAYSKCNREVCRKEASKSVTIDKCHVTWCKSDLCNGAKVSMVSAFLLLACALALFFR